ncbi:MAG: hypothetical protein ABSB99_10985 [Acidimicrobiales bacterium]
MAHVANIRTFRIQRLGATLTTLRRVAVALGLEVSIELRPSA